MGMLRPRGLQNRDDKVIVFLYFYFYFVFLWAWVDLRIRGDKVQAQPLPLFIVRLLISATTPTRAPCRRGQSQSNPRTHLIVIPSRT